MPRTARLDAPGLLQHVIIRGIEGRRIFNDDEDRENFIERLATLLPDTKAQCFAWALLPNHAHFLLRSGPSGIAGLMRRLLTGYALSYNARHKRRGHLFQNRYRSIICQEDQYLRELVRYIHLNPLRAKVVRDLEELAAYEFCGHGALLGKVERPWQETDYVLAFFGQTLPVARGRYQGYVMDGAVMGKRPELVGGPMARRRSGSGSAPPAGQSRYTMRKGDHRILGGKDFAREIIAQSEESLSRTYYLRNICFDFESVVQRVSALLGLEKDYIIGNGRQRDRVRARDLVCYWCATELKISKAELAERLGVTPSAVSIGSLRGEKLAREAGYRLVE